MELDRQEITEAFISYSRRNLPFARKLNAALKGQGLEPWFDQEDIPYGVDFMRQIEDGIQYTNNFLFIITPDSVRSPYCRAEIETAVKYNKRIIPLLYIDLQDSEDWTQMHPAIGRINWLFFEEERNFERSFENLLSLLHSHREYIRLHTKLLLEALEWQSMNRVETELLAGPDRIQAEKWLATRFEGVQAPCLPTALHAEFICESKKNAYNLSTEVFLSRAPRHQADVLQIRKALMMQGITCWAHEVDIKPGTDAEESTRRGIEQADNFVFFLSEEDSIPDAQREGELDFARSINKRIIPVRLDPALRLPFQIAHLQVLDFTKLSRDGRLPLHREAPFQALMSIIRSDAKYYNEHKTLLVQALRWQRNYRSQSLLLRGYYLENARNWLRQSDDHPDHPATDQHKEFIRESAERTFQQDTELYISYSVKDADFVRKLNLQLQLAGRTTWFDQEGIGGKEGFTEENQLGIDTCETLLFVMSPRSAEAEICREEVGYARLRNKRIIRLIYQPLPDSKLHKRLQGLPDVSFHRRELRQGLEDLIHLLDTDRTYIQTFAKYMREAAEWRDHQYDEDLLPKGNALIKASEFLKEAETGKKQPAPTDLLIRYIKEAQVADLARKEAEQIRQQKELQLKAEKAEVNRKLVIRQKYLIAAVTAIFIISTIFGVISYQAYNNSKKSFRERYFHLLSTMAELKARQIENQVIQKEQSLIFIRENPLLARRASVLLQGRASQNELVRKYLNNDLEKIQKNFNIYDIVISDQKGKILYKYNKANKDIEVNRYDRTFTDFMSNNSPTENRTYFLTDPNLPILYIMTKIEDSSGKFIAVLATLYKLDSLIFNITTDHNNLGETGEVIVGKYFKTRTTLKAISPLRHPPYNDNVKIPMILDSRSFNYLSLAAKNNIFKENFLDYRNKKVMATSAYVKYVDWGIVVKMDLEEVQKDFSWF